MSKPNRRELYRHFDKNGRLLYVGITLSTILRTAHHVTMSDWFDDVVSIKIERYASVGEALIAEGLAIVNESPVYNKVVSAGCGGRPRLEDVGKTLTATKPWAEAGMSRASWYNRQAEKRKNKGKGTT